MQTTAKPKVAKRRNTPHPPGFYPAAWTSAAELSAQDRLEGSDRWRPVEEGAGRWNWQARMIRLRAFRDGMLQWPLGAGPGCRLLVAEGLTLEFRKFLLEGNRWQIDLRWKELPVTQRSTITEAINRALRD